MYLECGLLRGMLACVYCIRIGTSISTYNGKCVFFVKFYLCEKCYYLGLKVLHFKLHMYLYYNYAELSPYIRGRFQFMDFSEKPGIYIHT